MKFYDLLLDRNAESLARRVSAPPAGDRSFVPADLKAVMAVLKPADVLLVDGHAMVDRHQVPHAIDLLSRGDVRGG